MLAAVRAAAAQAGIWVHLGSLAVRRADGRYANRGFVIDAAGDIRARYDKLHLFDVDLPTGESWRESRAYAAGTEAVVVASPVGRLGLSICYDLRLRGALCDAQRCWCRHPVDPVRLHPPDGDCALARPDARARDRGGGVRRGGSARPACIPTAGATFGHSLVVDPWGDVLLDMGDEPGLGIVEIDPSLIADVRGRIPVRAHRRPIPPVTVG